MDLDLVSCARLLQSCTTYHWIRQGRQLHLLFLKRGALSSALMIGNSLLQMYARCGGNMSDARRLFDEMPERNCFTWNTMIEGFMRYGHKKESLEFFNCMPQKNDYSWATLVSGFAKAGELEVAQSLFNDMPRKNGVAWNSMVHGYVQNGRPKEAIRLFKLLNSNASEPSCADTFVLATVLGACTSLTAFDCGKQIHARMITGTR